MEFISISSDGVGYYINPCHVAYISTKANKEGKYDIVFSCGDRISVDWDAMFTLGLSIHNMNKSKANMAMTLDK